jgi:hypothetical protein
MRIILTESQLNKLVNEQLTNPETELSKYLGDFEKINLTGDTEDLGLSNFTTPEDFVKKIKELPLQVSSFRIDSEGFNFPIYKLSLNGEIGNYEVSLGHEPLSPYKFVTASIKKTF